MKEDPITKVQRDVENEQKHRDGIPQLAVGVFLSIAMLLFLAGNTNAFVVFIPLIPIMMEGLRRRITYPRIGYAKVREESKNRHALLWIIFAILIGGIVAFLVTRGMNFSPKQSRLMHSGMMYGVALIIIINSIFVIIRKRSKRMIWYSAVILVFVNAVLVFQPEKRTVYLIVLAFGLLHVLFGTINLISFMKKYPVLKEDEPEQ